MNGNATANNGKFHLSTSWPLHRHVNEEVAELASEFCSQHAYRVFTVTDSGVTVRKVPSGFAGRSSRPGFSVVGCFQGDS